MSGTDTALWTSSSTLIVPDNLSDPAKITARALQLRDRERKQVAANFKAQNYEVAASFVWIRTMALLKKQLSTLGMGFVGELLQRSDITETSDVRKMVSDSEAIALAKDLGIITPIQNVRLLQSQEIVYHFSGMENDPAADQNEMMTQEEAISCLRICVQGVLGHDQISAAENFKTFRAKLETETLDNDSPEIKKLDGSPYFFIRTAISILLTAFKSGKGVQLEHATRNAQLIIPRHWPNLKAQERYQIGRAYSIEFNEGRKDSVRGLHAVLLAVKGFDFVPETLRSSTFIEVANKVISAHQGMNNFYNEPAPMRELASLGSSIPSPALPICLTAIFCVKLGNPYGFSHAAQVYADQLLKDISHDRWVYYFNERLDTDRIVLQKLTDRNIVTRWINMVQSQSIEESEIIGRDTKILLSASKSGDSARIRSIAEKLSQSA